MTQADIVVTYEEAQGRVRAEASPLPTETVPFHEAAGRVLAEALKGERDDPPGPKSAMDGYALRAADTRHAAPGTPLGFHYRAVLAAGHAEASPLPESPAGATPPAAGADGGRAPAVRIMTGARLPPGADAVVKLEDTEADDTAPENAGYFRLRRPIARGEHVIPRAARMETGELLLAAGEVLAPQALGVLASTHRAQVLVYRRPVVALLALGDELADVGTTLGPGKIPLTNLHVLTALVRRYGGEARPLGIAPDDPERIFALLEPCLRPGMDPARGAAACDMLLTLGGSHRGDFDFVHAVFARLGARLHFDRVRMSPGTSTVFATQHRALLFGLPGSPASSWGAFELLVRPALWKLAGRRRLDLPRVGARLGAPLPQPRGRVEFVACQVRPEGGVPTAYPIQGRHPHESPASLRADGLIRCEPGAATPVGAWVTVDWLAD